MASSFLKGLVTDYGKLGYQLWHRPLKMASLVYEREIGGGAEIEQALKRNASKRIKEHAWGEQKSWGEVGRG